MKIDIVDNGSQFAHLTKKKLESFNISFSSIILKWFNLPI